MITQDHNSCHMPIQDDVSYPDYSHMQEYQLRCCSSFTILKYVSRESVIISTD
jgi:hypothetical protein